MESWWDGHWISEKTAATAEAAEKSVEFSNNQKPAEAETSFGIEAKRGSCLQNMGFESVMGYRLPKAFFPVSSVEVVVAVGKVLSKLLRGLAKLLCSATRWTQSRNEVVSAVVLRPNQTRINLVSSLARGGTFGSNTDKGVWKGQSLQTVAATAMPA